MAPAHLTITWPGGSAEPLGTFTPLPPDMGFRVEVRCRPGRPRAWRRCGTARGRRTGSASARVPAAASGPACRWREQGWTPCPSARAALERFSAPTRDVVRGGVRRADARAGGRLGGDRRRSARAGGRADRVGQDAVGVPLGDRPAADRGPAGREAGHAGSSTSPRSRRWRSTSSATCARRWPASGRPPSGSARGCPR